MTDKLTEIEARWDPAEGRWECITDESICWLISEVRRLRDFETRYVEYYEAYANSLAENAKLRADLEKLRWAAKKALQDIIDVEVLIERLTQALKETEDGG